MHTRRQTWSQLTGAKDIAVGVKFLAHYHIKIKNKNKNKKKLHISYTVNTECRSKDSQNTHARTRSILFSFFVGFFFTQTHIHASTHESQRDN